MPQAVLDRRLQGVIIDGRKRKAHIADGAHAGIRGAQQVRVDLGVVEQIRGIGVRLVGNRVQLNRRFGIGAGDRGIARVAVEVAYVGRVDDGVESDVALDGDRKSTRLNSSHGYISYAVF